MPLTEFLLARITEDEARAQAWIAAETPREVAGVDMPARVLAECEAKRRIVERFAQSERLVSSNAEAYSAAMRSTPLDQERITALKTHSWELAGRRDGLRFAVDEIVAIYADHPDYREEWRP